MSQRRAIRGQSASILQEYGTSALRNIGLEDLVNIGDSSSRKANLIDT